MKDYGDPYLNEILNGMGDIVAEAEFSRWIIFGLVKAEWVKVNLPRGGSATYYLDHHTGESVDYMTRLYWRELYPLFKECRKDPSREEELDRKVAEIRERVANGD